MQYLKFQELMIQEEQLLKIFHIFCKDYQVKTKFFNHIFDLLLSIKKSLILFEISLKR